MEIIISSYKYCWFLSCYCLILLLSMVCYVLRHLATRFFTLLVSVMLLYILIIVIKCDLYLTTPCKKQSEHKLVYSYVFSWHTLRQGFLIKSLWVTWCFWSVSGLPV